MIAMKTADPFYKSTRWKKLRERVLRRDGYACQMSRRYGKMIQADTVHHIFPRDEFPAYEWQPWNLISLSASEHDKLHERKTQELTEAGAELLRRTARQQGIELPERYR